MTDLPDNRLLIQILGEDTPDDPDVLVTNEASDFAAIDGNWNARLIEGAFLEMLHVTCMSMTGGLRLTDVPAESRLKAIDDAVAQATLLIERASDLIRQETLNPDNSDLVTDVTHDEAFIDDLDDTYRLPTPEDLQP